MTFGEPLIPVSTRTQQRWSLVGAAAATACVANLAYALLLELADTPVALAIAGLLILAVSVWRSQIGFKGRLASGSIPGVAQPAAALGFFVISLVAALLLFIAVGLAAIAFE